MQPEDLRYSETHEWVRVDGDIATIGITDHAQSELGDVVYVELPALAAKVVSGEIFGTVESVKTVSDLISPVNGEVVTVHEELQNTPEAVNQSPYDEGWLIKVKMDDTTALDALMTAEQYESFIQEQ